MIFIIILVTTSLILIPFLREKSRTSLTWFACQPTKKMVLHPGLEKKREALKRRMPTFPPSHPPEPHQTAKSNSLKAPHYSA